MNPDWGVSVVVLAIWAPDVTGRGLNSKAPAVLFRAHARRCRGRLSDVPGMPRKKPKLSVLAERIATARRIIEAQQALLERLRVSGEPTYQAEAALRTYVSSLAHLLAHADKMREEALAKKGETKKEH